ncbi:hypothetical protein DFH06DRAFT_1324101 [Mycena polygramma]|nr:hypothetical protein DFH06DRAFT_1324101 [Mycena polygramma]
MCLSPLCPLHPRTAPLLIVLTLPQLRKLDLHHPPHFDTLQAFLARSGCVLNHLGLGISTESEATLDLYIVLRMFPSLSSLRIHAGPHIEAVLYLLGETGGTFVGQIVPKLRALVLTTSGGDRDCEDLLFFLQNRRRLALYPVALQSFHLELVKNVFGGHAPFPNDPALASLAHLMHDGLDIMVSTRESRWPYHRMFIDACAHFPEQRDYLNNP